VTEDSDAFAVIVSEETGVISFAISGMLRRNLDGPSLRRMIQQADGALAIGDRSRSSLEHGGEKAGAGDLNSWSHRAGLTACPAPEALERSS
jgi:predicted solute-binding protein